MRKTQASDEVERCTRTRLSFSFAAIVASKLCKYFFRLAASKNHGPLTGMTAPAGMSFAAKSPYPASEIDD